MSDGISDNFDPVLLKEASAEIRSQQPGRQIHLPSGLPQMEASLSPIQENGELLPLNSVTPEQRQAMILAKMSQVLKERWEVKRRLTARDVREVLITHAIDVTEDKRKFLEQYHKEIEDKDIPIAERRVRDRQVSQQIKQFPGKLDHATIAACTIGKFMIGSDREVKQGHSPTHSYYMNTAVTEREFSQQQELQNCSIRGGSVFYQSKTQPTASPPNLGANSPSRPDRLGLKRSGNNDKSHVV